jgi:hypothetical protein
MKLYLPNSQRDHLMFLTPGNESEASDFWIRDEKGDPAPRQFTVRFVAGVADMSRHPSALAKYMLDKGLARKTPPLIVMPSAQAIQPEARPRNHRILGDDYHGTTA